MTVDELIKHNRAHGLTSVSTYIERASGLFCLLGIFGSLAPFPVSIPYFGKSTPSLREAVIQVTLLLLLCNIHNIYEYYIVKLDISTLLRILGAMVYTVHFAAAILSFVYPSHWLVFICCICMSIMLVHLGLWLRFRRCHGHPHIPVQKAWLRRGFWHLSLLLVYTASAESLNSPHLYEVWNGIHIDARSAVVAAAFISDIQMILTIFAAYLIWVYSFRQIRISFSDGFAVPEVTKMDAALKQYYLDQDASILNDINETA